MNIKDFLDENDISELKDIYPDFESLSINVSLELLLDSYELTIKVTPDLSMEFIDDVEYYIFGKYKLKKLSKVKESANEKLKETDWVVNRYRDQVDDGIEPDMLESEYLDLLNERESIRDESDEFEKLVKSSKNKKELDDIKIKFKEKDKNNGGKNS